MHKARILRKKTFEKTFLDFKKWVKSIQTKGYNGARTVYDSNITERNQIQIPHTFRIYQDYHLHHLHISSVAIYIRKFLA